MTTTSPVEKVGGATATYVDQRVGSNKFLSRNLSKVAFKQVISGGAVTYGYGYLSVSEMPKLNSNQVNSVDAALTVIGRSISY